MGLPVVEMTFSQLATTVITRSSRGIVLLLLADATKEQVIHAYASLADVEETDWTADNYKQIRYAFKGKPTQVLCVRAVLTDKKVDVTKSLPLFKWLKHDWFACPSIDASGAEKLASYYTERKRTEYNRAKAVLPNCAADSEAVVNFTVDGISIKWDSDSDVEEVTTAGYCSRIAGLLAGLSLSRSATNYALEEVVDAEIPDDPDSAIDDGELIFVYDGEDYVIGRGVTSLQDTSEIPEDFKKIKLMEAADIVRNDIIDTFNSDYKGKVNGTYDNKQRFVGAVLTYLKGMEGTLIDGDNGYTVELDSSAAADYLKAHGRDSDEVDAMSELELNKASTGSNLFIKGSWKFLDALEDMSFQVQLV